MELTSSPFGDAGIDQIYLKIKGFEGRGLSKLFKTYLPWREWEKKRIIAKKILKE